MRIIVMINQKEGLRLISFIWSLWPFSDKMHPTYFHVQNFGTKAILFHFLSTSGGSLAGLNGPYAFRHNCSSVLKKKVHKLILILERILCTYGLPLSNPSFIETQACLRGNLGLVFVLF